MLINYMNFNWRMVVFDTLMIVSRVPTSVRHCLSSAGGYAFVWTDEICWIQERKSVIEHFLFVVLSAQPPKLNSVGLWAILNLYSCKKCKTFTVGKTGKQRMREEITLSKYYLSTAA